MDEQNDKNVVSPGIYARKAQFVKKGYEYRVLAGCLSGWKHLKHQGVNNDAIDNWLKRLLTVRCG